MRKFHKFILSLAVAALGAQSGLALSCLPATIPSSFQDYSAAPELYRVLWGEWRAIEPIPNSPGYNESGAPLPVVRYQFVGRSVGLRGINSDRQAWNVRVQPGCAGPWCAGYPRNGETAMIFAEDVRQDGSRLRFEPGPCGGASFEATRANLNQMLACMRSAPSCEDSRPPIVPIPEPEPEPEPLPMPRPLPLPESVDQCGATGELAEYIGDRVENLPYEDLPRRVRFIRPGDIVTMDHIPRRLNVHLSRTAMISRLSCG